MFKKFTVLLAFFFATTMAYAQLFTSGGINYNVIAGTKNVEVGDNRNAFGNLTIPASVTNAGITYTVTSIGNGSFFENTGLTSLVMPNTVVSIGYGAFRNSTGLKSIKLSNSLKSIVGYAFFNTAITTISIPASVTSINPYAFGQNSLTSVICDGVTPLTINAGVFYNVNQSICSLTVPAGSVDAYKAADVWKNFNPITSGSTLSTVDAKTKNEVVLYSNPVHNEAVLELKDAANTNLEVIDMTGKIVLKKSLNNNSRNTVNTAVLTNGIYLFKVGNAVTKVVKN